MLDSVSIPDDIYTIQAIREFGTVLLSAQQGGLLVVQADTIA